MPISIVKVTDVFPSATSGTITIPATTAGNVLIAIALTKNNAAQWVAPNFISSSDGNFTEVPFYTLQGGSLWDWATFASAPSSDVLYQVTSGGVTAIHWNASVSVPFITIWEVSGLKNPVVVDDFKRAGSSVSAAVTGSALSPGANDLCIENFSTAVSSLIGCNTPWLMTSSAADQGMGPLMQIAPVGSQPAAVPIGTSHASFSDIYVCASVAFAGVGAPATAPDIKYIFTDGDHSLVRYVDSLNNIHTLQPLYSNDGTVWDYFGAHGGIDGAHAIAIHGNFLYATNGNGNTAIWQIDLNTGIALRVAGGAQVDGNGPPAQAFNFGGGAVESIATDNNGNVYMFLSGDDVYAVNLQNTTQTIFGVSIAAGDIAAVAGATFGGGVATGFGMAFDSSGNMYYTEEGDNTGHGNKVWKVPPAGASAATVIAGVGTAGNTGDGGPATAAELNAPWQISCDKNGVLYVASATPGNVGGGVPVIRAINTSSSTQSVCGQTIAPGSIATLRTFTSSDDIWFTYPDNQGNLYMGLSTGVSTGCKVAILDPSGNFVIVAGSGVGTCGYSGDGAAATSALVGRAFGVTIPAAAFCGGMRTQIVGNPLI